MCEVQGVGAPDVGGERGASPPPERLSVSSSGAEEDHNSPRDSLLLGRPDEGHAGKPSENTSKSGEIEACELTPATSGKTAEEEVEDKDKREKKMREREDEGDINENNIDKERKQEQEEEVKEKYIDEERKEKDVIKEKLKDEEGKKGDIKEGDIKKEKITDEEKEQEEEKEEEEEVRKDKDTVNQNQSEDQEEVEKVKESESEAKDAERDFVGDETERENQENERRDEMVENRLKLENVEDTVQVKKVEITFAEKEMKEKVDEDDERKEEEEEKEEENRHGNDEQAASSLDSLKVEERQQEEEEEKTDKTEKKKVEHEKQGDGRGEGEDKHEDGVKNKSEEEIQGNEVKKEEKDEKEKEEEKEEGVDPFRPKSTKDASTSRKVTKTVNFLDTELKKQIENNLSKRHTLNSTSSSISSSSSKSKEEADEQELARLEGETGVKPTRQWTLGEGNPVYRLSLKLSPNLFNSTDIPGANQHKEVEKTGFLNKLSGRSFPYIPQWKRRYCVLSKGRLYYYEREDSKAGDKANGVIQLEYFDQVAEAGPKECKKATNVFIITSQDRSFFDPGRHLFSADTLPDMKDWIRRLQAALDQIRNNNRPAASTSPSASPSAKDGGGKRRRDEAAEGKDGSKGSQQQNGNKDRKKKKEESGRGRKSSRGGVSSQTQTMVAEPVTSEVDGGRPTSVTPKGGVMLPGFSSRKDPQAASRPAKTRSGEGEAEEDLPQAGPTLSCITKQRVKGPQGRRAPQNRRVAAAAALKKRASSLSALEHQDAADNRSESSDGATRSSRDSRTPEGDLKAETESKEENERKKLKTEPLDGENEQEVRENLAERQFKIDNVDDGLFFKAGLRDGGVELDKGSEGAGQKNKRNTGLRVNFEEDPEAPSKNGTLGKFSRFRDTILSTKRKKYETKETTMADHPDMVSHSRWSCVVL